MSHYPATSIMAALALSVLLFGPARYRAHPKRTVIFGCLYLIVAVGFMIAH